MVAVAAALAWAAFRLRPFRVEVRGESMRPTLEPGDWCLALAGGRVRSGDVVVLERAERPGLELVKRVTGAPGDEGLGSGDWRVEGDNPDASTDSRAFGAVRREAMRGRVAFLYWPPRRWRLL
ncbi:MAG: S26 family signal peptidase [Actinomycetota bacterium]